MTISKIYSTCASFQIKTYLTKICRLRTNGLSLRYKCKISRQLINSFITFGINSKTHGISLLNTTVASSGNFNRRLQIIFRLSISCQLTTCLSDLLRRTCVKGVRYILQNNLSKMPTICINGRTVKNSLRRCNNAGRQIARNVNRNANCYFLLHQYNSAYRRTRHRG